MQCPIVERPRGWNVEIGNGGAKCELGSRGRDLRCVCVIHALSATVTNTMLHFTKPFAERREMNCCPSLGLTCRPSNSPGSPGSIHRPFSLDLLDLGSSPSSLVVLRQDKCLSFIRGRLGRAGAGAARWGFNPLFGLSAVFLQEYCRMSPRIASFA
jgi:hypothetical protein